MKTRRRPGRDEAKWDVLPRYTLQYLTCRVRWEGDVLRRELDDSPDARKARPECRKDATYPRYPLARSRLFIR